MNRKRAISFIGKKREQKWYAKTSNKAETKNVHGTRERIVDKGLHILVLQLISTFPKQITK
jgi:hypothetical protein